MSASLNDVNLIIISQGQTQYWAGMKSCGNVFLDIRFGLYSGGSPDLLWIEGTPWDEMLEPLDGRMESPIYGELTVDFDRRLIQESTGWSPFELFPQWLLLTWTDPADAPVSKQSLKEHLALQRVRVLKHQEMGSVRGPGTLLKSTMLTAKPQLQPIDPDARNWPSMVSFDLPAGWTMESVD
ncbi:hypothetical protein [Pseudomonas serbica]|uniref:hypothetical protein n=1 Tax=Pseudomonas serbica TaxID=2965074 RepID=UPI00237A7B20|nr:hypothetical protein [Pseudomonas serbica]